MKALSELSESVKTSEKSAGMSPSRVKRFLRSGKWAEYDQSGHGIVQDIHHLEATRRFSLPR